MIAKVFYHEGTHLSSVKVDIDLTFSQLDDIFVRYGEMSERFKELVLKTSDGETHREFESHTLRQRITVILIQQDDGYFIPKISILRTFRKRNF